MKTLFEADRQTLPEALEVTAQSLDAYGDRYPHWAVAYSGGKDSSATVTALCHLLETGRVRRPRSLTVLYADTRLELPPLQLAAQAILGDVRRRGYEARTVLPPLDDRFLVYILGRGVPPPKNRFRWCTSRIKIEPMLAALRDLRERSGGKLLMLTGVRLGESAQRDARIALSCSRDGAECGQGWFQEATPESVADTLAPLLHWRLCHVTDWLWLEAPALGWPTAPIAEAYGQAEEGHPLEVGARTGCICCPLASRDTALDRVLRLPQWAYLAPLKRLRRLWEVLTLHQNRIRKANDEVRADGTPVKNPGRIGPLTLAARQSGLEEVLAVQAAVNAEARRLGRPTIDLLNPEEDARIRELIAANTWPNRWDGTELPGDTDLPEVYADGSTQHLLFG